MLLILFGMLTAQAQTRVLPHSTIPFCQDGVVLEEARTAFLQGTANGYQRLLEGQPIEMGRYTISVRMLSYRTHGGTGTVLPGSFGTTSWTAGCYALFELRAGDSSIACFEPVNLPRRRCKL